MVTGTDSSREKHPHIRQMHTVTSTGLDSKKEEQQCRDKRDLQVLLLFFLVSSHHRLNEPTTESLYFGFIASLNATLAKCVSPTSNRASPDHERQHTDSDQACL